jgi:MFS family permease
MAMGVNQAAAMSGSFIGLVLGGVLAPINWRLIFLVSVPVGAARHGHGLPQAARAERTPAGPHRLAGQHHLRRRPDPRS